MPPPARSFLNSPGADFDVDTVQSALDSAEPGQTLTLDAAIEEPEVTASQLKAVLFRDVLGETKTHVSGSAGRIGNVKRSAKTISGRGPQQRRDLLL